MCAKAKRYVSSDSSSLSGKDAWTSRGQRKVTPQIPGQSFLSMEKSVAKKNTQLWWKLKSEEVNTLARTSETNVQVARHGRRINPERFENLSSEMKVSQICETTGFLKKISAGTILPNHSRCGWWGGRKERVMQRVYVTSWSSRFWICWVDQRTHQDRSSSSIQSQMLSWSIWNGDTSSVYVEKRIKFLDPEVQIVTWTNLGMTQITLPKTVT